MSHTSGPWEAVQSPTAGRFNIFGGCHVGSFVAGSKERLDEAHSNARLIAAAPELLEALTSLYEYACRVSGDPEPEIPRLRQARLAIAKARGDA